MKVNDSSIISSKQVGKFLYPILNYIYKQPKYIAKQAKIRTDIKTYIKENSIENDDNLQPHYNTATQQLKRAGLIKTKDINGTKYYTFGDKINLSILNDKDKIENYFIEEIKIATKNWPKLYSENDVNDALKKDQDLENKLNNAKVDESVIEQILKRNGNLQRILRERAMYNQNYRCAICGCKHEPILEAAHIWDYSSFKSLYKNKKIDMKTFEDYAKDDNNIMVLCANHHKMFDSDIIRLIADSNNNLNIKYNNISKDDIRSLGLDEERVNDSLKNYSDCFKQRDWKKVLFYIRKKYKEK